jgi:Competence protein J (ComJ)
MSDDALIYTATIVYSYSQLQVFDSDIDRPGFHWTEEHVEQGFARQSRNVSFATLSSYGTADVAVFVAAYEERGEYERVIAVPFELKSGKLEFGGPEESAHAHGLFLPNGHYRLVAAQTLLADDRERVDLYFEKLDLPLRRSRILVADEQLRPPATLSETAEVA